MKTTLNYSDKNYREAINLDRTGYYNFPMTIDIGQHKLILGFGSSDRIREVKTENNIYLIGENSGLDYISCVCIDISGERPEILNDVFLQGPEAWADMVPGGQSIFDLETEEQINILSNWFE